MTPENFSFWIQGYLEIGKTKTIGPNELTEIKNHLKLALLSTKTYYSPPYDPQLDCSDAPIKEELTNVFTEFKDNRKCHTNPTLKPFSDEIYNFNPTIYEYSC